MLPKPTGMDPLNVGQASHLPFGNDSQARRLRYKDSIHKSVNCVVNSNTTNHFPENPEKVGSNT